MLKWLEFIFHCQGSTFHTIRRVWGKLKCHLWRKHSQTHTRRVHVYIYCIYVNRSKSSKSNWKEIFHTLISASQQKPNFPTCKLQRLLLCACEFRQKIAAQVVTVNWKCLQCARLIRTSGKSKWNLPDEWDQPLHYLLSLSTIEVSYWEVKAHLSKIMCRHRFKPKRVLAFMNGISGSSGLQSLKGPLAYQSNHCFRGHRANINNCETIIAEDMGRWSNVGRSCSTRMLLTAPVVALFHKRWDIV